MLPSTLLAAWLTTTALAVESPQLFAHFELALLPAAQVVGAEIKSGVDAAALADKLDAIPYPKALRTHRFGDLVTGDVASWSQRADEILRTALGAGTRLPQLSLKLRVTEVLVLSGTSHAAASVTVHWELLDGWGNRAAQGMAIRKGQGSAGGEPKLVEDLLVLALTDVPGRSSFVSAVQAQATTAALFADPTKPIVLTRCGRPATDVPTAVKSTVVVRADDKIGAGVAISPEGYVVTAYHVVHGARKLTIRQDGGEAVAATVVRVAPELDAALLSFDGTAPCVAALSGLAPVGSDVYAVGTPSSEALAFTVTRGIISGVRPLKDGRTVLQTDASINPGNSGGPLVDAKGRWLGVVSFKLVGAATEGLGFGVPAQAAIEALGVSWK